jgi:hypothetical protein
VGSKVGGKGGSEGKGVRNDPNIVCTYEYNKKRKRNKCLKSKIQKKKKKVWHLDSYLTSSTKINSKTKDLDIHPKTNILKEEQTQRNMSQHWTRN